MSRIDASLAPQVADISRPPQTYRDSQLQAQQAQVKTGQAVEQGAPVSANDLQAAAGQLKQVVEIASGRQLSFDVDDASRTLYVKIKDLATGEVIKQIPSKEMLALRKRLDDMVGLLLNKKA